MNKGTMTAVGGAIIFVVGLLIGLMAGGGSDVEEIEAAIAKRLDAAAASENERLAALEANLGGRLDQIGSGVEASAAAAGEAASKLGADVQGLGQALAGAIESSAASSLAAVQSGLEGLRAASPAEPAAPAHETTASAEAPEAAALEAAAAAAPVEGFGPGETAILGDGALRVFVSRIDAEAGTARLRVGGTDLTLAAGASEMLAGEGGACRLTLDAVGGGKAALSAACGDALPAPVGAAPGVTVNLAEGLRVFVSGATEAGARIAVNGVATQVVPVGQSVDVAVGERACTVTVEGVDRGRVALAGACG